MDAPSDILLARYLAGETARDETHAVEQWAAAAPAHRARLEHARALWETRQRGPAWDVEGMWTRLRQSLRTVPARRSVDLLLARERRPWRGPLAAAAILVLAVGVAVAVVWGPQRRPAPAREYATARGQRGTLRLPDGSRLVLAPLSRLEIPADFGPRSRDVRLEGEALFTVVHDTARPFRIHAGASVVEDIGTRFDVRAYPEDSSVAVAVAEGAVALGRAPGEGVLVRSGEIGTLAPRGLVATTRGAGLADYLDWANSPEEGGARLHFADVPLPAVLRAIGRWYDLDVRLGDGALAPRTITAEFSLGSPDDMLQALAVAVGARLTRSGPGGRIVTLAR